MAEEKGMCIKMERLYKNMFSDCWRGICEIVLYGLGLVSERCIGKLITDFKVSFIIDQKKRGTKFQGISVIAYEDALTAIKSEKKKIVVTTSQKVYLEIKDVLQKEGFQEYEDFCWVEEFVIEWYWKYRKQINIFQVDTAVTTYCTFHCKNCNMFLPYYKERKHYSFEELRSDMDLLLKNTDYVFVYMFLGGEPFLNPQLHRIIAYAGETYADKIGRLSITTNASVVPDELTLHILKKYDVRVVISDYTKCLQNREIFFRFTETLREKRIPYTVNKALEWKDFGFPKAKFDWGGASANPQNIRKHMAACSPLCHGVNDGKFYYCHIIWSAEKAGLFQNTDDDYIELEQLDPGRTADRRKLSQFSKGNFEKGYLEFCKNCGGFGVDNQCYVPAGIQMEKDIRDGSCELLSNRT